MHTKRTNETKDHPFKSNNLPFMLRLVFSSLTVVFKVLSAFSPRLAGRLGLHLFMRPPQVSSPRREHPIKEKAILSTITINAKEITLWVWENEATANNTEKKTILLSHGWAGRTTQFFSLIEALIAQGYRVVGADIPAHGESSGKKTNMVEGASILGHLGKQYGPFYAIIGHSFGTGTTLLALDKFDLESPKIVLIGAYSRVSFIINLFAEVFDLNQKTIDAMKQIAVEKFGNNYDTDWTWDNIAPIETIKSYHGDIFFIHDEEDHEVPWHEVDELHKSRADAELMKTNGLGHRRILRNKEVVDSVVAFIQKP